MTDHSDDIAYIQVVVAVLQDLDPGGTWTENKLFKKWQANHYSLTVREFKRLSRELIEHLDTVEKELGASKYNQLNLFQ